MPRGLTVCAAAALYLALEALWLRATVGRVYAPMFAAVAGRGAWRPAGRTPACAAAAYVVLLAGFARLVMWEAEALTYGELAARAATYGLAVYGTYNLTNMVTFEEWSLPVAALDTAWGVSVAVVSSVAAKALAGRVSAGGAPRGA